MSELEHPDIPVEPKPLVVNQTVIELAERRRQRIARLYAAIDKAKAEGRSRPDLEVELAERLAEADKPAAEAAMPETSPERRRARIQRLRVALETQADPGGTLQAELLRLEREENEREGR
jgi:hypothetical protein